MTEGKEEADCVFDWENHYLFSHFHSKDVRMESQRVPHYTACVCLKEFPVDGDLEEVRHMAVDASHAVDALQIHYHGMEAHIREFPLFFQRFIAVKACIRRSTYPDLFFLTL